MKEMIFGSNETKGEDFPLLPGEIKSSAEDTIDPNWLSVRNNSARDYDLSQDTVRPPSGFGLLFFLIMTILYTKHIFFLQ